MKRLESRLARLGFGRVRFSACGGQLERLLGFCMENGIQLQDVEAFPGGFRATVAAGCYRALRRPAKKCRTNLHIVSRRGPGFTLRHLLRRPGLLAGILVFLALLRWGSGVVWAVRFADVPEARQSELRAILREADLCEGAVVSSEKIAAARLMMQEQSGNLGWVALNFAGGRLVVERTPARSQNIAPAPRVQNWFAAENATVLSCNIHSGFAAVVPGQTVARGQLVIAASKPDHSGASVWQGAEGIVNGVVCKTYRCERPLTEEALLLTGEVQSAYSLKTPFGRLPLSLPEKHLVNAVAVSVSHPVSVFGFALPATLTETTWAARATAQRTLSETAARQFAHYVCLCQLHNEYPDARIEAENAAEQWENGVLCYALTLRFCANIARPES